MELISACPLSTASLLWQPRPGTFCLTVICKATFQLEPHEARLASDQEPIRDMDDLAPAKPRADIVLVGHAYAPRGEPVRSITARLRVGAFDKAIEVVLDRAFLRDGTLREGAPFTKMPLVYERAAGGPDTWNPVGRSRDAWTPQGMLVLPNLQAPGARIASPGDIIEPAGFGPIAPAWPLRRKLFGREDLPKADPRLWRERPMPKDIDLGYFNVAPPDQQVNVLQEDARITLDHLHPEHTLLSTMLPGVYPRAAVERPGRDRVAVPLRCDTLCIDTDRRICTLAWRGQVLLAHAEEPGWIRVTLDPQEEAESVAETSRVPSPVEEAALLSNDPSVVRTMAPRLEVVPALPFASAQAAPVQPLPPATPLAPAVAVLRAEPVPPPLVHAPVLKSALEASNAAVGTAAVKVEAEPVAPKAAPRASGGLEEGEVLQLVWYAPESMLRIRRRKIWRAILDEVDERPIDPELDDPELSATPAEVENRRAVMAILRRGEPLAPEALEKALAEGIHEGTFTPKITLVAGELWLPFSELGLLEALIAIVTPLAAEDEKLRAAVRAGSEFAANSWAASAPTVAEGLGARIKELLRQGKRGVPLTAIEAQVERAALERRAYQKRTVLGGTHLRGLLQGPGGQGGVSVYLPERLSAELPMYQRFNARLLAEVHPPVDQQEAAPAALRVVGFGRVVSVVGRR